MQLVLLLCCVSPTLIFRLCFRRVRVHAAGTTSSDRPRELPDAIESGAEPERTQKTERGAGTTHPQQRESGLPRSRGLSTEGLKPAPEPISSEQEKNTWRSIFQESGEIFFSVDHNSYWH